MFVAPTSEILAASSRLLFTLKHTHKLPQESRIEMQIFQRIFHLIIPTSKLNTWRKFRVQYGRSYQLSHASKSCRSKSKPYSLEDVAA